MNKKKIKKRNSNKNINNFIVSTITGVLIFITLVSILSFAVMNFNINKDFFAVIIAFIIITSCIIGTMLLSKNNVAIKSLILSFMIFLCFFLLNFIFENNNDIIKIILMLPVALLSGLFTSVIKNRKRKI